MKDVVKEYHKDKIQNELATKIKTVMIGAIASIEKEFGELWAMGQKRPLTNEEALFEQAFMRCRKEILDKGNTQIKNAKALIDPYDIEYIGYTLELKLPVVRNKNEND